MPAPITGVAVAQAATQLRIIELDQIVEQNISDSMNFAIDFTNQTFRITGLQLRDWLAGALVFPAENVVFDSTIFVSIFPAVAIPDNVQDALDSGFLNVLPLTGGDMTDDINLSNGLSVNTVTTNADAGNIGKVDVTYVADLNTLLGNGSGFYFYNDGSVNTPLGVSSGTLLHSARGVGTATQLAQGLDGFMYYRVYTGAAWTAWLAQANTNQLLDYLPLTGGTLTGLTNIFVDGKSLRFRPTTLSAPSYLNWQDADTTELGHVGRTGNGNDMSLVSLLGNTKINAAIAIELGAPTTNVSGHIVIDAIDKPDGTTLLRFQTDRAWQFQTGGIDANTTLNLKAELDNKAFNIVASNNDIIFSILTNDAGGSAFCTGDITAFNGIPNLALTQPAIAQTGKTTSFELIEHLLDKIEELENRLDAGGL